MLSAIAIWGTLRGYGPFATPNENESLLLVQVFIGLVAVPSLVLAAAVQDRQRAEEAIRAADELVRRTEHERLMQEQANRAEAEQARQRSRFLADASVRLAGSLDYPATLQCAVRLPVPSLADCCVVETGSVSEWAEKAVVGFQDPSDQQPLEEALSRYPFDPRTPSARRSGHAALFAETPDHLLVVSSRDADHLQELRGLGLKSAMIVPLVARRQTLGTMSLYSTRPDRRYQEADLALAEDLAQRTALALDNARLYAQQREVVDRLQQLHGRLEAFERERLLEDERRRIAGELHDRVEQTFFGIGLSARAALDQADHLAEPFRSSLASVVAFSEQGADQLREAIFALNRVEVQDRVLVPSLWRLVRDFRRRASLEADLVLSGRERRVSPEAADILYAVAREALINVERHAAASVVVLSLCFEPSTALLTVQDDGSGVSPLVLQTLADSATHFGLRSLRERVKRVGGTFMAQPGEDGGFVVRALVPLQEPIGR